MSRWLPERLLRRRRCVVGVDARCAVLRLPGQHQPVACALEALAPQLQRMQATQAELVVASDVSVHWVQQVPPAVANFQELQRVAAARCSQLFGGEPGDWMIAADWQVSRPFVCAAIPRSYMARLAPPRHAGMAWHWTTLWTELARHHAPLFPRDGWSALRTPNSLQLWHCRRGRVEVLQTIRVEESTQSDAQLAGEARRQIALAQAQGQVAVDAPLHWLTLVPAGAPEGTVPIVPPPRLVAKLRHSDAVAALHIGTVR